MKLRSILTAPFTPYSSDPLRSIRYDIIPLQAKYHRQCGATVVWIGGMLGDYEILSPEERMKLHEVWNLCAKENSLDIIVHVADKDSNIANSIADHASTLENVSIAIAPVGINCCSPEGTASYINEIASHCPGKKLYYYHYPAYFHPNNPWTFCDITTALKKKALVDLDGVKFVSSDLADYFKCSLEQPSSFDLMHAPEPKLATLPLASKERGHSVVLAEVFGAMSFKRLWRSFVDGDFESAQKEQEWKSELYALFSSFGPKSQVAAMRHACIMLGLDIGPCRSNRKDLNEEEIKYLQQKLKDMDFISRASPEM